VNLVVATLVILGGLGFVVMAELGDVRRRVVMSLHTKLVLSLSVLLVIGATLVIFLLERGNPRSLADLPPGEAWLAALFQAVSPRTAGFNTLDIGALREPTLFLIMALMFIGAAPGGTGGGVKISTFAVTVLALWATVRGHREPTVFHRRLSSDLVSRSFFICLIGFLVLNLVAGLVLVVEGRPLLPTLFETTSAFGTVGLSTGTPGQPLSLVGSFSATGKILLAIMMFAGRLGPLTLAVALAGGEPRAPVRYPEGKVLIG
jgi:trk system potassium uptake protein TrkH